MRIYVITEGNITYLCSEEFKRALVVERPNLRVHRADSGMLNKIKEYIDRPPKDRDINIKIIEGSAGIFNIMDNLEERIVKLINP